MKHLVRLILVVASFAVAAQPVRRPNIVFLLADDLRYNALGCMGDAIAQTPNIDALAKEGILFSQHFVTTSICCTSRASIFSGQYARRHGINDFATPFTAAQWAECYPALLRQGGYYSGFIGKFGVGNDKATAAMADKFDYWRGLPGQAGAFFIDKNDPAHVHKTARFGDEALEFLRTAPAGKPFCLSLSFNAPHARDGKPREFQPDLRDEALFAEATIPTADKTEQIWFDQLPAAVKTSEARKRWGLRFDTPEKFQRTLKDYYRLVFGIDREVGRIVKYLRENHLAENTIIVFTSDNGFFYGERGLADKWFMWEESIRVPLIIVDPRLPANRRGQRVSAMTLNIDFAPTMLDWAGIAAPLRMQGKSLVPVLRGETPADWRTEFFYEHHFGPKIIPPSEGVRTTRWKYIRWVENKPLAEELYDLQADPGEKMNLAASPAHEKALADMRAKWQSMREQFK